MDDKEEFERKIQEVKKKMEDNPDLQKKVNDYVTEIEKIFGHQIEVNLVFDIGYEEFRERYESYDLDQFDKNETMTLRDFINFLEDEDQNLFIGIDPINLSDGLNEIKDMLVIENGDKLIIVPKKE